jgi:hypothetical protein
MNYLLSLAIFSQRRNRNKNDIVHYVEKFLRRKNYLVRVTCAFCYEVLVTTDQLS